MNGLAERILSDLDPAGDRLQPVGDGWYVIKEPTATGQMGQAQVMITDAALESYQSQMTAEELEGAFGDDLPLEKARYQMTLIHLEEAFSQAQGASTRILPDASGMHLHVATGLSDVRERTLPPGNYQWVASSPSEHARARGSWHSDNTPRNSGDTKEKE